MNLLLYVIRDSVSGVYDRPMTSRSEGEMMRSFGDIAADKKHPIGAHPEHYSLWHVGLYNDNTGVIEPMVPQHVCNAIDLVSGDCGVGEGGVQRSLKEVK